MANTTNLNLVKPAGTDFALVSVINGNMDIIDSKVGAIPANESAQSQITALNNQITNHDGSSVQLLGTKTDTTASTYSLESSRKLSDYRFVEILISVYGQIQNCIVIDRATFVSMATTNAMVINTYTSERKYALVKYISDTQVNVQTSDAAFAISIYGIK